MKRMFAIIIGLLITGPSVFAGDFFSLNPLAPNAYITLGQGGDQAGHAGATVGPHYGYVANGLERLHGSTHYTNPSSASGTQTDRPMNFTVSDYLGDDFVAELRVTVPEPLPSGYFELIFFGFGEGYPGVWYNEPRDGTIFRIHRSSGYNQIDAYMWNGVSPTAEWANLGNYDGDMTFKIEKTGNTVTLSVPELGTSHAFDISGLSLAAGKIFFGNTAEGTVFNSLTVINTGVPPNAAPDVTNATPSQATIWPPNKKMVDITIDGVVDPDGDEVTITITSITSSEPGANTSGVGTNTASLEADRDGRGPGRIYTIEYTATDGTDSSEGTVTVIVPHDQGKGQKNGKATLSVFPNPANPATTISYSVPEASHITVTVFNTLGQQVRRLVSETKRPGDYTVRWNGTDAMGRDVTSGLYLIRVTFGEDQLVGKFLLVK